ncbi:MAG: Ppx/GppA phosphatase family protein [Planctomycetota bacterium]
MTTTGSMTATGRLAAIDVGTNTIRLVVVEVKPDQSFRVIDDERVRTRLGRSLAETQRLNDEAMRVSTEAIEHFRSIAEGYGVEQIRAVATSAVRDAKNGEEFAAMVLAQTGVQLDIIGAEEEARLAFLSVSSSFELGTSETVVVDVGGGSTEVILSSGSVIERICPLQLGAVRYTERFDSGRVITGEKYKAMRRAIRKHIREHVGKPPFAPHLLIGTGGTLTNLATMSMHRGQEQQDREMLPYAVRGYEMQRSEVKHFLNMLRKMPADERQRTPGLKPDRADIIVAGLTIVDCLLKYFDVNRLRVHDQGIRAGLIRQMILDRQPDAETRTSTTDRLKGVQQFADACHQEQSHARQVVTLSLQVFDDLAKHLPDGHAEWATPENRELLHVAALLHDVGYLISYSRHHKHSYHLIMHSGLSGFTSRELLLIANIARYHRGAKPKLTHQAFARLNEDDQQLVRRLAAIVRMAVGLDRSHRQIVDRVSVAIEQQSVVVSVESAADPSVELWGAEQKSKLFAQVFRMPVTFRRTDVMTTNGVNS